MGPSASMSDMMEKVPRTFDEYIGRFQTKCSDATQHLDQQTHLPLLERFALKIAYLLDSGEAELPASQVGTFVAAILSKLTNEMLAFGGAIRASSLYGSYHHVRAVMELGAAVHHGLADPSSVAKRVEQFVEFEKMFPWCRRRRLEFALASKKISQEQFDRLNVVSDSLIAHATSEQIDAWKMLFGVNTEKNLASRIAWHSPTIKQLFIDMDPSGSAYAAYEILCHPTHVSPLGYRLTGGPQPPLFGYQPHMLTSAINGMFGRVYQVVKMVEQKLDLGLTPGIEPELLAFVGRVED